MFCFIFLLHLGLILSRQFRCPVKADWTSVYFFSFAGFSLCAVLELTKPKYHGNAKHLETFRAGSSVGMNA
jgi:hypothetical protein